MRIEITDFPSDPNGECGNLRTECLRAVRKAVGYPSKQKLIKDVLKFTIKAIDAGEKERLANEKARAAKSKVVDTKPADDESADDKE